MGSVVSPALRCPYPWGWKSLLFAAVKRQRGISGSQEKGMREDDLLHPQD